jgi:hypothetical protein
LSIGEKLTGPRVSDEAFVAEVERTPGVWLVRGFSAVKQNINSRRQNVARVVAVGPAIGLLIADHLVAAGVWLFVTALLVWQPVTLHDYRRIRRAVLAHEAARGDSQPPPES